MDAPCSRTFFFVSFGLFLVLCLGGTTPRQRQRRDDAPPDISALIPDLFGSDQMQELFDEIEKSIAGEMKKMKNLSKVLDQYPDQYNKTFSKTEHINGTDVVTNTTIIKDKTGQSNAQMFIQQKTMGGDTKAKAIGDGGVMVIQSEPGKLPFLNDTIVP